MSTKRLYLEERIKKAGIKKAFIADRLGLSQSSFTHLLNGDRNLDLEEAKSIAIALNEPDILLDFLYNEHRISLYPGVLRNANGEDWKIIKKKKKSFLISYQGKVAIVHNWNPIWCSWEGASYYVSEEEAMKDWVK